MTMRDAIRAVRDEYRSNHIIRAQDVYSAIAAAEAEAENLDITLSMFDTLTTQQMERIRQQDADYQRARKAWLDMEFISTSDDDNQSILDAYFKGVE